MSLVPILLSSVFAIATYVREDTVTNALLWLIWGLLLALITEVRALRIMHQTPAAKVLGPSREMLHGGPSPDGTDGFPAPETYADHPLRVVEDIDDRAIHVIPPGENDHHRGWDCYCVPEWVDAGGVRTYHHRDANHWADR